MEFVTIVKIIFPCLIGIIMLGIGMTLTIKDFRQILVYPKAVAIGFLTQIILLPMVAFFLATLMNVAPETAVGIVLVASCPGGPTAGLFVYLARGVPALSITLTTINTLATIITIPLITEFSIRHFMGYNTNIILSFGIIFKQLLIMALIPIILGMLIRTRWPDFAIRNQRKFNFFFIIALIFIGAVVILSGDIQVVSNIGKSGKIVIALYLCTTGLGFFIAKLFRLSIAKAKTIAIEVGLQNGVLAMVIAMSIIKSAAISIPAIVYTVLGTSFTVLLTFYFRLMLSSDDDETCDEIIEDAI